jgi:carbon-monoxide dehydrogenase medium subunit
VRCRKLGLLTGSLMETTPLFGAPAISAAATRVLAIERRSRSRTRAPIRFSFDGDAVRRHIAHYPIRLRGTFCGSLANADPASEWCLVAVTLGATLKLRSLRGVRAVDADAFFLGYMTTAIGPDEILVEAQLPLLGDGTRAGFYEFSRRAGDFAEVMALATYTVHDGRIADARIGVGAIDSRPRRIAEAEILIGGQEPGPAAFEAAGEAAARSLLPDDPSSYRGRLAAAAVSRALSRAR